MNLAPQTPPHPSGDKRFKLLDVAIKRHQFRQDALIEILHTAQELFGYLDNDVLIYVGRAVRAPLSRVYGVATFYNFFSMKPPGEHTCVVCMGTACYVKGAGQILQALEQKHGIKAGETTEDGKVSLVTARCLGACGLAPAVVFDGEVAGKIGTEAALPALAQALADADNLARLSVALADLRAERITLPAFELSHLLRGHAVHFRCHREDVAGMRIDAMTRLRGVDEFESLWSRGTTVELPGGLRVELMGIEDLIRAKKTQQDKDWPMVRRLVEAHHAEHERDPGDEVVKTFYLSRMKSARVGTRRFSPPKGFRMGIIHGSPGQEVARAVDDVLGWNCVDPHQHRMAMLRA